MGRRRDSRVWVGGWTVDWTGEVGECGRPEAEGQFRHTVSEMMMMLCCELDLTALSKVRTETKGLIVGLQALRLGPLTGPKVRVSLSFNFCSRVFYVKC